MYIVLVSRIFVSFPENARRKMISATNETIGEEFNAMSGLRNNDDDPPDGLWKEYPGGADIITSSSRKMDEMPSLIQLFWSANLLIFGPPVPVVQMDSETIAPVRGLIDV